MSENKVEGTWEMTLAVGLHAHAHRSIHAFPRLFTHRDWTRVGGKVLESHQSWIHLTHSIKRNEREVALAEHGWETLIYLSPWLIVQLTYYAMQPTSRKRKVQTCRSFPSSYSTPSSISCPGMALCLTGWILHLLFPSTVECGSLS